MSISISNEFSRPTIFFLVLLSCLNSVTVVDLYIGANIKKRKKFNDFKLFYKRSVILKWASSFCIRMYISFNWNFREFYQTTDEKMKKYLIVLLICFTCKCVRKKLLIAILVKNKFKWYNIVNKYDFSLSKKNFKRICTNLILIL